MTHTIKTKETVKDIKTKDNNGNLVHFIKNSTINARQKTLNKKQEESVESNATNNVQNTFISTSSDASHRIKNVAKNKIKQRKFKDNIKVKDNFSNDYPISVKKDDTPKATSIKQGASYKKQMKNLSIIKHKNKVKETKETTTRIETARKATVSTFKGSIVLVKRATSSLSSLIGIGTGLIILLVITLFIGVFASFSSSNVILPGTENLSPEVLAYTKTIEKYAKEYDMQDYIAIIQAVMMQESSGLGNDPMQASESPFNEKYPKVPNGIEEPEYSIEVGVKTLADCFKRANVSGIDDTEHIYLALQGYNYGNGYIEWAINNFGGYSKANAKLFSNMKKQELGTNVYGDPNYVDNVMRYIGLSFGNIRGEPNFENMQAWGYNNPYSRSHLFGQCTWFAWGRFYEIYGYSPGFIGDGWHCAKQLVNAHPDKFELSSTPKVGAIYSGIGKNHVGIVIGWDGSNITIQDGNIDGKTNTFQQAKKDWKTSTISLSALQSIYGGVIFANPK